MRRSREGCGDTRDEGGGRLLTRDAGSRAQCVLFGMPSVSFRSLDNAAIRLHYAQMGGDDGAGEEDGPPAQRAAALRASLGRYFKRRIGSSPDVEDLVQEVFTRIAARDSTRSIDNLGSYVFQVAASVLADRHRRRVVRHADDHIVFNVELHSAEDFDPDRILGGKEELRAAIAALLCLPERTRTIFFLHRMEGHRARDIAAQLGISVSAVEKHMVRAVQHLVATVGARDDR